VTARGSTEVEVEGRRIALRNLDKVFYPETGFTKGDLIDYYARVAPVLLPHLRDRPLTLKRYPEGAHGPHFYEKRCPGYRPAWMRTATIRTSGDDDEIRYCVVDGLAALVWLASIADLELHTPLALAHAFDHPTTLAFDLDPGPPADVVACCEVALLLRSLMERLGLASFAKTSGSKGLQIYVPLDGSATYEATKAFAHAVARALEQARPALVVERMQKSLRPGKVLVDWSQNDRNKTTVCAYSLRARSRPTVSTPVTWHEVEHAARTGEADSLVFEAADVLARVTRDGDLFAPVLSLRQRLPDAVALGRPSAR
jgi:bifunctional non-homologous end joining protein LigD